jgi:hypothetical protein
MQLAGPDSFKWLCYSYTDTPSPCDSGFFFRIELVAACRMSIMLSQGYRSHSNCVNQFSLRLMERTLRRGENFRFALSERNSKRSDVRTE